MKRAQLSTGEAYYHCASDTVHLKSLLDAESKTEFVKILHKVAAIIDTHALRMGVAKNPEDYPWCGFAAARADDA